LVLAPVAEEIEQPVEIYELPSGYRFAELSKDLTGEPVRRLLSTGNLSLLSPRELRDARKMLRRLQSECADRIWVEESSYVNDLLSFVNRTESPKRAVGFQRSDPDQDIYQLKEKRAGLVNSHEISNEEDYAQLTKELAVLDNCYRQQAERLDEKYQNPEFIKKFAKPSKDLIDARCIAKHLLKQNRIEEAARQAEFVAQMERSAGALTNEKVSQRYYAEDRRLKEEFATKRQMLILKAKTAIDEKQRAFEVNLESIDRAIAKLERQIQAKSVSRSQASSISPSQARRQESGRQSRADDSVSSRLALSPPAPINRGKDATILNKMTEDILAGQSRRSTAKKRL
jgi:hypothetical protein